MSNAPLPPEAVEELASRLIDGDLSWQPTHVQEQVRRDAVAAIDALLPHLRPLFETATKVALELGRKEAAEEIAADIEFELEKPYRLYDESAMRALGVAAKVARSFGAKGTP